MSRQPGLPRSCRAYVGLVSVAGAFILARAIAGLAQAPPPFTSVMFPIVALFSGPLAFRIPSLKTTISASEGLAFAATLLFGPSVGVLTALADGVGILLSARQRDTYRTLFNVSEPVVCVGLSAVLFYRVSGVSPLLHTSVALTPLVGPILVMVASYFILNTLLTGTVVWLETHEAPLALLRSHLPHLSVNLCVSVPLAAMIVRTSDSLVTAAVVVLAPMLLVSYLSSNSVAGRLADANRHLAELRRLYDSTIETLAMAIDAKDQVTHGHIRRVQVLSTGLASAMGASADELSALEAAALLHDLGKLAVPEHILNKPGKLTPAEFDQMKLHAAAGASMLAGIEFPFPVIPVVRHHHENWDGSGYPDGLSGQDIPLGARILSVVDCYDALTSDRPYRRRLTPLQAVDMIRARSGTAYDPRVVDAFLRVYESVPPEQAGEEVASTAAVPLSLNRVSQGGPEVPPEPRAGSRRASVDRFLANVRGREGAAISDEISAFIVSACGDAAIAVLYGYDPVLDQLTCPAASAQPPPLPLISLKLGSGVSGWAAANRRAMMNADAALDLGDGASALNPPMRACTSAPVIMDNQLVGVLSVYSPYAFSEPQCELIAAMAEALGPARVNASQSHAA